MFKGLLLAVAALVATSTAAFADEGTSEATLPRSTASTFRIIPVAGASSFSNSSTLQTNNFGNGMSFGLFGDFGADMWTFETGILSLQSRVNKEGSDQAAVNVDTWGIPLLAKFNFSGHPHQTVFAKAGIMPFNANAGQTNFDVMAVGGIGANIPLGHSSSIILDAAYNRLFTRNGNLTDYQGVSLLAGLSLNI